MSIGVGEKLNKYYLNSNEVVFVFTSPADGNQHL